MTTPQKLRPGEVGLLARWSEHPPFALSAGWVAGPDVVPRISGLIVAYRDQTAERDLSKELKEQNALAVPWLLDALKALDEGDFTRLQDTPRNPMPGKASPACWYEAHRRGLDFKELVRARDVQRLREIVIAARTVLKREAAPPKGKRGRGQEALEGRLLRDVDAILRECSVIERVQRRVKLVEGSRYVLGDAVKRRAKPGEARDEAYRILRMVCKISMPANHRAIAAKIRRA